MAALAGPYGSATTGFLAALGASKQASLAVGSGIALQSVALALAIDAKNNIAEIRKIMFVSRC
jgi:hypothetical protein